MKEILLHKEIDGLSCTYELDDENVIVTAKMKVPRLAWYANESMELISKGLLTTVDIYNKDSFDYIKQNIMDTLNHDILNRLDELQINLIKGKYITNPIFDLKDLVIQYYFRLNINGDIKDFIIDWKKSIDIDTLSNFENCISLKYKKIYKPLIYFCSLMEFPIDGELFINILKDVFSNDVTEKPVFTYFIKDKTGLCKIGKTLDVSKRIKSLSTSNATLELLFVIKKDVERILHIKYSNKRVNGEWFSLSHQDLDDIKTEYKDFIIN